MASSSSVSQHTTATNLVSTGNVAASSVSSTYTKTSVVSTSSEKSVSTTKSDDSSSTKDSSSSSTKASSSASSTKSKNAGSALSAGVSVNWKLSLLVTGLMALGFVSGN
ncbi:hypothetical protein ACO0R3_001401 [Hanseniaspora guilliermondii]